MGRPVWGTRIGVGDAGTPSPPLAAQSPPMSRARPAAPPLRRGVPTSHAPPAPSAKVQRRAGGPRHTPPTPSPYSPGPWQARGTQPWAPGPARPCKSHRQGRWTINLAPARARPPVSRPDPPTTHAPPPHAGSHCAHCGVRGGVGAASSDCSHPSTEGVPVLLVPPLFIFLCGRSLLWCCVVCCPTRWHACGC